MRPILMAAACVLGLAGTAAAQDGAAPFVSAEPSFRATNSSLTGGNDFGLDLTVGLRSWKGLQPIFQGGRLIDVHPADLIRGSSAGPFARQTSTGYLAAGVRFLTPRLWRFQPYAESTSGVGQMNSDVEAADGPFRTTRVMPVLNIAFGAEFPIGRHFTIDAGYRRQGFFGSANVMRVAPRLAFGVRF